MKGGASRALLSAQLFRGLKTALALYGIGGCCPLVAALVLDGVYGCCLLVALFPRSISKWGRVEEWGQRLLSARPLHNLV